MITLEQKVDLILQYIATDDESLKAKLKREAAEYLQSLNSDSKTMDDVIEGLLKEIGVSCKLKAREFISCAVKLIIEDGSYIEHVSNKLYPTLAEKFNSTPSKIERAIRYAITVVFTSRDVSSVYDIFGNSISVNTGKPTNTEFIATCVNEVKRRMR